MGDRIGISVTIVGLSHLFGDDLAALVEAARIADEAGVDQLVLPDHLAIGTRTDRYPYGEFPLPREEPWLEPVTTLAAMAGATRRIRLGTGILIVPLRPALLLAKTLASLDVLSRGRLDLGVGTGWQREEFDGAGVPFSGRTSRMDDTLRACRVLWRQAPASFRSPTVRFDRLWCLPRPLQPGGIPIWIGGALTPGNVARLVEYGVGWMPLESNPDVLGKGIEQLREAFAAAGRDPETLQVRASAPLVRNGAGHVDLDATLEALPAFREVGVTLASFALARFARRPDQIRPFLERLGRGSRGPVPA